MKVENLSVFAKGGKAIVDDISFQIRAGEIVGIAGVEGNGQAEILDALMGIESASGRVQLKDEDVKVDLSQLNCVHDKLTVVVTEPLTTNEQWTAFEPNQLMVFVGGELLNR